MTKTIARSLAVGVVLVAGVATFRAFSDESVSPYIDQLQKQIREKDAASGKPSTEEPYTESEQKKLKPEPGAGEEQPYIDSLKKSNPKEFAQPQEGGSYTEQQKAQIGPGHTNDSAIAATNEGRSKLEMKRPGKVTAAFGFEMGLGITRNITVQAGTGTSFASIYGGHFVPDFTLFGEHQFFNNNTGSLGLVGSIGASYYWGYGQFSIPLFAPDGTPYGSTSKTHFSFGAIPASVGFAYRLHLLKYFHPFVMVKPTLIGYFESRDDGISGHQGISKGVFTNFGVNVMLDNVNKDVAWDLYSTYDVKHVYLTLEFQKLTCFASDVDFNQYGINVGFTFEY